MVKDLCFEIIDTCLNNCVFCSSNSNCNKKTIIEYEDIKRVIDYFMSKGGIKELSLSGGEPFLHPDILKIVSYTKSLGIRTVIFTSGVAINPGITDTEKKLLIAEMNKHLKEIEDNEPDNNLLKERIKHFYDKLINPTGIGAISRDLLVKLKELGLDKIVFDYQAYLYETDHALMGRKEENRQALLKSLITAASIGLEVDIHFVPMKPNYSEIIDILEMLEIAGIKNISILNFIPQGRGKDNQDDLQLTNQELTEFFGLLEKGKQIYSGNIRLGITLQGDNTHKCNAGLEKLDIKFDGTVLPCPAFKEITSEECQKYNIKLPNIYTNLEDVVIPGVGTRVRPLCKDIYLERTKKINPEEYGRIVSAALLHDGCIYMSRKGHYDIFPMEPIGVLKNAEQGFVTEYGYFVDRKLGLIIANYFNQIESKYPPLDRLVSEDLKKENIQLLRTIKKYLYKDNNNNILS